MRELESRKWRCLEPERAGGGNQSEACKSWMSVDEGRRLLTSPMGPRAEDEVEERDVGQSARCSGC